jgi:SPP1 family predicted phage head-tail adaptor
MDSGRLRHRVTFEELIVDKDSDGATTEDWAPMWPPVSAEITPMSGRELIAASAVQSKVTHRIKVRFRPGFKPSMRGVHRGTIYNIEAVIPDPDSGIRFLTLLCTSGINEG